MTDVGAGRYTGTAARDRQGSRGWVVGSTEARPGFMTTEFWLTLLGAIGVVQLDHQVDIRAATAAAVADGVWLRPFRDLIYTMPPYITGNDDLARITHGVLAAVTAG